jgi:hypothetical protein
MNEIARRLAEKLFDQPLIQNQFRSTYIEAMIGPCLEPEGWRYRPSGREIRAEESGASTQARRLTGRLIVRSIDPPYRGDAAGAKGSLNWWDARAVHGRFLALRLHGLPRADSHWISDALWRVRLNIK